MQERGERKGGGGRRRGNLLLLAPLPLFSVLLSNSTIPETTHRARRAHGDGVHDFLVSNGRNGGGGEIELKRGECDGGL